MRYIPLLLLCLLLQACTRTQEGIAETLKNALFGHDDIVLTNERIQAIPYASMYLRINNEPQIFVVLGYDEEGLQKWITQDQTMLVTRHGRLVKTLGLSDNLVEVNNLQQDPLNNPSTMIEGSGWSPTISWTEHQQLRSGTATSRFFRDKDQVLNLADHHVACRVYHEKVEIAATGQSWENIFWIDATSGQVRKTQQMLGADSLSLETTILKPAK